MNSDRLVSRRRKEMAAWAVANLKAWPTFPEDAEVDPAVIGCEFIRMGGASSLPVLSCRLGGGFVDSLTFFYARRGAALMAKKGNT